MTPQGTKKPPLDATLYHYCLQLEYALAEFYGMKGAWYGTAGSFANAANVKSAILAATKGIRRRVADILTVDERLQLSVEIQLGAIERAAKTINKDGRGVLEVLAGFVHLSATLLGFDWLQGRPNREVIYFQTRAAVC